jgi:hypothetical protein
MLVRLINIYHKVPTRGHGLRYLLEHELDELTPMVLARDFNTHAECWSLKGVTLSAWATPLYK